MLSLSSLLFSFFTAIVSVGNKIKIIGDLLLIHVMHCICRCYYIIILSFKMSFYTLYVYGENILLIIHDS